MKEIILHGEHGTSLRPLIHTGPNYKAMTKNTTSLGANFN
jgi:hypothetical protein